MKLQDRFAAFKTAMAPDLWPDVVQRESADLDWQTPPRRRTKIVAAVTAFAVAAGLFLVLSRSFGSQGGGVASGQPVMVSAVSADGRYRCTAVFPSDTIAPGHTTGVTVTVTNLSNTDLDVPQGVNGVTARLAETAQDGTLLQDTSHMHDGILGPAPNPHLVAPGDTVTIPTDDAPLLWSGAIATTVSCPVDNHQDPVALEPVALHVIAPGDTPSPTDAIARAVAAASPTFDLCAPTRPGAPVTGLIDRTIDGDVTANPPTVRARCEVAIIPDAGFDIVVLGGFCPPESADYPLTDLATEISAVPYATKGLIAPEQLTWRTVVVSSAEALPVHGATAAAGMQSSDACGGA